MRQDLSYGVGLSVLAEWSPVPICLGEGVVSVRFEQELCLPSQCGLLHRSLQALEQYRYSVSGTVLEQNTHTFAVGVDTRSAQALHTSAASMVLEGP